MVVKEHVDLICPSQPHAASPTKLIMLKVESEKALRRMVRSPGFEPGIISFKG
jgi:hypothetical protein